MDHRLLLEARDAHIARTKHKGVFIGVNGVECLQCKKHAHITFDGKQLLLHTPFHDIVGPINARDF
ncbi:unnamed protein product [marine sediment metagenome]|uniref:Uncharacterized protein n=1 Tax=marine sediment metagenome TaxID=412755 RepID=X0W752_9ZZZZ